MRSTAAGGLAFLLFFGFFNAMGCGSDDDRSGASGTAGTSESGAAGAAGNENLAAGEGGALAAGAGGLLDLPGVFPCAGPITASSAEGGEGGGAEQTASGDQTLPAVSCIAGESFCFVYAGKSVNAGGGTVYIPQCANFSENASECATNPSCACFCASFACDTECRCEESNGIATVTCEQI